MGSTFAEIRSKLQRRFFDIANTTAPHAGQRYSLARDSWQARHERSVGRRLCRFRGSIRTETIRRDTQRESSLDQFQGYEKGDPSHTRMAQTSRQQEQQ